MLAENCSLLPNTFLSSWYHQHANYMYLHGSILLVTFNVVGCVEKSPWLLK